jgi:hypothetical protein
MNAVKKIALMSVLVSHYVMPAGEVEQPSLARRAYNTACKYHWVVTAPALICLGAWLQHEFGYPNLRDCRVLWPENVNAELMPKTGSLSVVFKQGALRSLIKGGIQLRLSSYYGLPTQ